MDKNKGSNWILAWWIEKLENTLLLGEALVGKGVKRVKYKKTTIQS